MPHKVLYVPRGTLLTKMRPGKVKDFAVKAAESTARSVVYNRSRDHTLAGKFAPGNQAYKYKAVTVSHHIKLLLKNDINSVIDTCDFLEKHDATNGSEITAAHYLAARAIVKAAENPDGMAFARVLDRTEGKVPEVRFEQRQVEETKTISWQFGFNRNQKTVASQQDVPSKASTRAGLEAPKPSDTLDITPTTKTVVG